jgi:hypothetical protein
MVNTELNTWSIWTNVYETYLQDSEELSIPHRLIRRYLIPSFPHFLHLSKISLNTINYNK